MSSDPLEQPQYDYVRHTDSAPPREFIEDRLLRQERSKTYEKEKEKEKKKEPQLQSLLQSPSQSLSQTQTQTQSQSQSQSQSQIQKRKGKSSHFSCITPNLNFKLENVDMALLDYKSNNKRDIYFVTIAPCTPDHIDLYTDRPSDLMLRYCCGLYMPIDQTFTTHTMLSNEFLAAIKQQVMHLEHKKLERIQAEREKNYIPPTTVNTNTNTSTSTSTHTHVHTHNEKNTTINDSNKDKDKISSTESETEIKKEEKKEEDKCESIPVEEVCSVLKLNPKNQRVVIFLPGYHYTSVTSANEAAQMVLNDAIKFYQHIDQVVIPFLWPTEGYLINNDENYKSMLSTQVASHLLCQLVQRLNLYFEYIDFVAHSEGCNILCVALEQITKNHNEICKNKSHVVFIAPNMGKNEFIRHITWLKEPNVKRLTLYTNTWDWWMTWSKWYQWSEDRAGHSLIVMQGLDTIDVTETTSTWLGSNHYYLTDDHVIRDVVEALSVNGGKDCSQRKYLKRVYSGVSDRMGHYKLDPTANNTGDGSNKETLEVVSQ